jgi:exodeoxyribonuclease V
MQLSSDQVAFQKDFAAWYKRMKEIPIEQRQQMGDAIVYVLKGYAGSGKTSQMSRASKIAEEPLFLAPTAKAASRLVAKGCEPAATLHSAVYTPSDQNRVRFSNKKVELEALDEEIQAFIDAGGGLGARDGTALSDRRAKLLIELMDLRKVMNQPTFLLNPGGRAVEHDLIIMDESSMCNKKVCEDVQSFGIPILAAGDPGQLPPVASDSSPWMEKDANATLTTIHRQAEGNPILDLATAVRMDLGLQVGTYGDSRVVRDGALRPGEGLEFDQIICGKNETRFANNRRVRALLGYAAKSVYPTAGEKLICLYNEVEHGVMNGVQYTCLEDAEEISATTLSLEIMGDDGIPQRIRAHKFYFDGSEKKENLPWYRLRDARQMDYGYVITCHKAQGSEWDRVLVLDESRKFGAHANKWLYTAITRAAKSVTVVVNF